MKSHYCGQITSKNVDEEVTICGWVHKRRDHGGVIFIDLRDISGICQVVVNPDQSSIFKLAESVRNEYVLQVKGKIVNRSQETINKNMLTGEIELIATNLVILSKAKTPAFPIDGYVDVNEDVRLKNRFLDLRRTETSERLLKRSKITAIVRDFLQNNGFNEIETPILTKATPEGARDYVLPSRVQPGSFFALPQSPQLFKQLLMIGGFDRYYQIAKCFRDEDLRADRQPEFTQIDIEASFIEESEIISLSEELIKLLIESFSDHKLDPFPTLSWDDSMERYGCDKPDLRIKETITDDTQAFDNTEIKFIQESIRNNGKVLSLHTDKTLSRKDIDRLDQLLKDAGSNGLGWFKILDEELSGPLVKFLTQPEREYILSKGDGILLFQSGEFNEICKFMDILRRDVFIIENSELPNFIWVEDFPFFEIEDGVLQPSHHPFTAPKDIDVFKNNPDKSIALHYDLVLNGVELGSGSQRINSPDIQRLVLEKWGLSAEEIENRFGWFIEALSYGTPQHAGFAIGIDRLVAEILKQPSIRRDVSASSRMA